MKVTMSVNNKHTLHLALEATMHIEAASRQRFFLSLQQESVHNIIIYLLIFFSFPSASLNFCLADV